MLGLEIRAISQTKDGLTKVLEEILKEIKNGSTNMYLPLNDCIKNTESDFSICDIKNLDLYDNWDECSAI